MQSNSPTATGWICTACRVILGGLFVAAGLLKLRMPQGFADSILGFKLFDPVDQSHLVVLTTFVVPWTEVIAGLMLLVGLWARASAAVIATMLVAFIAGVISVIVRGIETKCSCFGNLEWPCAGGVGWCQVIRNCVMIAAALPVIIWGAGALAVDRPSTQ
jgi:uncharacterized membrane protein YphA (DoxX/SURF4 family)